MVKNYMREFSFFIEKILIFISSRLVSLGRIKQVRKGGGYNFQKFVKKSKKQEEKKNLG